ncbi:DUF3800 domain-containing protein [Treponema sp.]|uniref:DUF3800 domain-containing protein n=1 Tax=Treponema sp. TaxID=166 RepID=UPI003FA24BFF
MKYDIFILRVKSAAFMRCVEVSRLALFFFRSSFMYLLYADDSGNASDPDTKYSVLAGFATYEDQPFWIEKAVDEIMFRHIGRTDLELHASPMRSGRGVWRGIPKEKRNAILKDCLEHIRKNYPWQCILFGAVIDNKTDDADEILFTQITSRFDKFLKRKFLKYNEAVRGLAVFDKSKLENQYQSWSRLYQSLGNMWKEKLNNFAEVPLFLDSRISRSIQLADLIAFSLFRYFEHKDDTYYSVIRDCFDKDKNQQYGLYVLQS